MATALELLVYDKKVLVYTDEFDGPVELGRQSGSREGLYTKTFKAGQWRVVIASYDEESVSRRHALLEPLPGGRLRLSNTSAMIPIRLVAGGEMAPNTSSEMALPVLLAIGRRTVCVQISDQADPALQTLAQATMAPGRIGPARRVGHPEAPASGGVEVESLVDWFQAIIGVLQTAASSSEFFPRAARAVVEVVGLDTGQVLVLEGDQWRVEAQYLAGGAPPTPDWRPSRKVLKRLHHEKRTFWHEPDQSGLQSDTLGVYGLTAVVASPILDGQGNVIAALYGERRLGSGTLSLPRIMKIDAMVLELLASGVATGLARVEQEKAVMAARVQFEQFFTPALASELAARPDLLKGRNLEVTLLFCDVRGFSRISERLGPSGTVEWISDVMGILSDCVLAHQGVLVDYIGDELIAMWGAPQEEPQHAQLACRAALDMLDQLPTLNQRWSEKVGEPFQFGIGINTGIAQVGNTGTNRKFKYGALGNTVNIASRVQGATKYLRTPLVITGATQARLDPGFSTRRLCKVGLVNIVEPVALYELISSGEDTGTSFKSEYERALVEFESRNIGKAIRILGNLIVERPDDGPSLILLSRAVSSLVEDAAEFDPVWTLPGK
jgi:adenylate cyclase